MYLALTGEKRELIVVDEDGDVEWEEPGHRAVMRRCRRQRTPSLTAGPAAGCQPLRFDEGTVGQTANQANQQANLL